MADLLVEARRERAEIVPYHGSEDPRVPEALSRLTELERSLREVGTEAAAVHQLLQHIRLI